MNDGDLIIAGAIVENNDDGGSTTFSTQSGSTSAWTEQQEVNVANNCVVTGSTAASTAAGNIVVRNAKANNTNSRWFGQIAAVFRDSDGIGTGDTKGTGTGGPSLSVTTTQANSALVVFVGDFAAVDGTTRTWRTVNGTAPSAGNGFELAYFRDSAHYTIYVAYYPDAGAAGAKTVGLSAPTGQTYAIVAVEVLGTAGGGGGGGTLPQIPAGDIDGIIGIWDQLGVLGG